MTDGITIIQQTTSERQEETKKLWKQIKPLLDAGMIYSAAAKKSKKYLGPVSIGTSKHGIKISLPMVKVKATLMMTIQVKPITTGG